MTKALLDAKAPFGTDYEPLILKLIRLGSQTARFLTCFLPTRFSPKPIFAYDAESSPTLDTPRRGRFPVSLRLPASLAPAPSRRTPSSAADLPPPPPHANLRRRTPSSTARPASPAAGRKSPLPDQPPPPPAPSSAAGPTSPASGRRSAMPRVPSPPSPVLTLSGGRAAGGSASARCRSARDCKRESWR